VVKKVFGAIFLAILTVMYFVFIVMPLRFIIAPMLKHVKSLSPWQFVIGNIPYLVVSVFVLIVCYWGFKKAFLMMGSLKPTTYKWVYMAGVAVIGYLVLVHMFPRFHLFYILNLGSNMLLPRIHF
jgi:hypothetical protein